MGPMVELRYYSMLFVVVFLGGHALLNWQIKRGGGGPKSPVTSSFTVCWACSCGCTRRHVLFYDLDKAIDDPIGSSRSGREAWRVTARAGLIIAMYCSRRAAHPFLEGSDRFSFSAALAPPWCASATCSTPRSWSDRSGSELGHAFSAKSPGSRRRPLPLRYPSQIYEITLGVAVFVVC